MANWAIVIGVNQYWTPPACLTGAIPDALRMREWLLDKNGGDVPPQNLFLLLSPKVNEVPADLKYLSATYDSIVAVIERVVQQSGATGDRLFFHYSGHGLSAWINFSEEDALLPSDFAPQYTTKSISLRSILEYFEATQLREQVFFIDACRNIPWEGDFRIGYMPLPRRRDPGKPAIQQFVFYATSPGVRAAESLEAGNEQGAFTDTLLKGLQGQGRAKVWNYAGDEYLVRVNRLFDYLVTEMEKKKILVSGKPRVELFQIPRLGGERGAISGSDPILARFPAEDITDETLDILVQPFSVEAQAAIEIRREETTVGRVRPITSVPVNFKLRPKEYVIVTEAVDLEPEETRKVVDLYDSQQITINLVPKSRASKETVMRSGGGIESVANEPLHLTVTATDPLAVLEIASSAGEILNIGQGVVEAENLEPGFYRARLVSPEGPPVEKLVELTYRPNLVQLEPPTRVETEIWGNVISQHDLRNFTAPRAPYSTVRVVFRIEPYEKREFWLRFWSYDKVVSSLHNGSGKDRIKEFRQDVPPGNYWLSLEFPGQKPIVFAFKLLPGRATLMIVDITEKATNIYQYSLGEAVPEIDYLRRIELIQRFYLNGRLDHAYELWRNQSSDRDPIAYCLIGYVLLRLGIVHLIEPIAAHLAEAFREFSDVYVLRAEHEATHNNHDRAAEAYHTALDHGLPIVSEGLVKLLAGIERYEIEHPRKDLLRRIVENRSRGLIWSAWMPESISPEVFS